MSCSCRLHRNLNIRLVCHAVLYTGALGEKVKVHSETDIMRHRMSKYGGDDYQQLQLACLGSYYVSNQNSRL